MLLSPLITIFERFASGLYGERLSKHTEHVGWVDKLLENALKFPHHVFCLNHVFPL